MPETKANLAFKRNLSEVINKVGLMDWLIEMSS